MYTVIINLGTYFIRVCYIRYNIVFFLIVLPRTSLYILSVHNIAPADHGGEFIKNINIDNNNKKKNMLHRWVKTHTACVQILNNYTYL